MQALTALQSTEAIVSQMTIRNLGEALKGRLRVRAAHNGRSMEEEARQILRTALAVEEAGAGENLGERIHAMFHALGGVELTVPKRARGRRPPDFSR